MKKLILLILFLMPLVKAEIVLDQNIYNLSVSKGIPQDFQINLTNTYNFDVYNLTFSGLQGFSFPEIDLLKQESKVITFTVLTNYSFDGLINSNIKFRYKSNIPEDITIYNLTIDSTGINGVTYNYLTIRKGDSVNFINHDIVTHQLSSTDFENTLLPSNTFSKVFNEVKTIDYRTLVAGTTFFTGTIEVINRTGEYLVYNPIYDKSYQFRLTSIPEATELNASVSDVNYTVEISSSQDGLLTIRNIGTNPAENIYLSSDPNWIQFDENNFDLSSSTVKYIKFKIIAQIFDSNETNLTHEVEIKIKGINTNEYVSKIYVFVPFSNAFGNVGSLEWFTAMFFSICQNYPNSPICNSSNLNQTARIIYRESEFSVNMTGSEWYNLVKRIGIIEDIQSRSENKNNLDVEEIKSRLGNLELQNNETSNVVKENIDSQNAWTTAKWVLGFFVLLSICVTVIVFSIRNLNKKKEMVDVYTYRR